MALGLTTFFVLAGLLLVKWRTRVSERRFEEWKWDRLRRSLQDEGDSWPP